MIADKKLEELSNFLRVFTMPELITEFYYRMLERTTKEDLILAVQSKTSELRAVIAASPKSEQLLNIWKMDIGKYLLNLIELSYPYMPNAIKRNVDLPKGGRKRQSNDEQALVEIINWSINAFTTLLLFVVNELVKIELDRTLATASKGFYLNVPSETQLDRYIKIDRFISELIENGFVGKEEKAGLDILFAGGYLSRKVNWISSANELGFLFDKLRAENRNLLVKSKDLKSIWERVAECFTVQGTSKTAKMLSQNREPKNPGIKRLLTMIVNRLIEPPLQK